MDRLFRGIIRYRNTERRGMVQQFEQVKNNPVPKAVFFTCMDSRMIPSRFTQTNVGDMFIVRNAGNIIPHSHHFMGEVTMNEPAALELGCVVNDIRHIIICGHSDCKAMNLLYKLKDSTFSSKTNRQLSPLRAWLCNHAHTSLEKYHQLELCGTNRPLMFSSELPLKKFAAYIDPEKKWSVEDRLSQVNTLEQLANVASYNFLKRRLESHQLHVHALWFDIYTGDIYYFSRQNKKFVEINEFTVDSLSDEVRRYYS
ncbi:carbonic anhydrase [Nesidiocoris tenuis]|uniref:Carbonic anhydrase n=1 Tax=Nesidiocoris tenuis TaxID=355587 RepID=A0ABN7AYP5_9HEMI|nr:carbonic anhydrase [Nesidiocoris tenuis]